MRSFFIRFKSFLRIFTTWGSSENSLREGLLPRRKNEIIPEGCEIFVLHLLGENTGHLGSPAELLAPRHGVVPVSDAGVALQVGVLRPVNRRPQTFRRRALLLT